MLVQLKFLGGPKDGEVVTDELAGEQFGRAAAYYFASDEGAVGSLLWCRTEYLIELNEVLSDACIQDLRSQGVPLRGHLYVIDDRSCGADAVWIRARHAGAFPDSPRTSTHEMSSTNENCSGVSPRPA
jgi:hypothetical protein